MKFTADSTYVNAVAGPIVWKDITTYTQGDKNKQPSVWEVSHGGLSIVVVRGHLHYPEGWVFHCRSLGIDTRYLTDVKDEHEAKQAAVNYVVVKCNELLKAAIEINKHL